LYDLPGEASVRNGPWRTRNYSWPHDPASLL